MIPLAQPVQVGRQLLPHRIAMAPMTRNRAAQPGNVPSALNAEYYRQRAGAALIITEASQVSEQGQGYSFTPGVYTPEQIAGWRLVTDAVHAAGGRIFLQLWHVGRMSHPSFHSDGLPVAPSALAPDARVWVADAEGVGRMLHCPTPRALETEEIPFVVEQFRSGAAHAMRAGFDGVEIHGANGYLIDQFLRTTSNHRTDQYGGSTENRMRFALEVADAVIDEIGADRVGMRLAPYLTARNMACPEIIPTILSLAHELDQRGLAYLHLVEADWDDAPEIPEEFRHELRAAFRRAILAAGRYDAAKAERYIEAGLIDVAAFGRPYIANPDLAERILDGHPLSDITAPDALFGGGAEGYTTYAAYGEQPTRNDPPTLRN